MRALQFMHMLMASRELHPAHVQVFRFGTVFVIVHGGILALFILCWRMLTSFEKQDEGHTRCQEMLAIAINEPGRTGGSCGDAASHVPHPIPATAQLSGESRSCRALTGLTFCNVKGGYPPPPGAPLTPGLEVAGEVVALGEGCSRYKTGDFVCALVPGGGYAEYCVAEEDNCLPIPQGMTLVEAAGLPETYFTVWTNVFQRGRLQAGETFLVHGGTSGIGSTAILLAKQFGAKVIATAGSDEKCLACLSLGADLAINYRARTLFR